MQKRWCERIPVSLSVAIYRNGQYLGKCEVKNLSLCGICLISKRLAFYKNTKLTITFPDAAYMSGQLNSLNAVVIRSFQNEIGLMFDPVEPDLINSIIKHTRTDGKELMLSHML